MKGFIACFAAVLIGLSAGVAFGAPPANDKFENAQDVNFNGFRLTGSFTVDTAEATNEAGEPNHLNMAYGRSVWFKWTAPAAPRPMTVSLSRSNYNTVLAIYTGTALDNLVFVNGSDDLSDTNTRSLRTFLPQANKTYYFAVDGKDGWVTSTGVAVFDFRPALTRQSMDYDDDGRSDIAVFRPSDGTWYALGSDRQNLIARKWGSNGDIPVVGDYTRSLFDRSDFVVFRPSNGAWYVSHNGNVAQQPTIMSFGQAGDIPVTGDFVGNQELDLAVYRPSNGTWYFHTSNAPFSDGQMRFGLPDDIPVPGDYDQDNRTDVAVYRPSEGNWYVNSSEKGFFVYKFGLPGDQPVRGDFDGDGVNDFCVFRPSTGTWYFHRSSNNTDQARRWGQPGDLPVSGDFDGDGRFDFAVYRASNSNWYILSSGTNFQSIVKWGQSGDLPLTGNYNY